MADCTYLIKPTADITQEMLGVCQQNAMADLRSSNDGRSVLKWQGINPPMFSADTKYTHAQILAEMAKPEWVSPSPPE